MALPFELNSSEGFGIRTANTCAAIDTMMVARAEAIVVLDDDQGVLGPVRNAGLPSLRFSQWNR